jgi:hypothetical protein
MRRILKGKSSEGLSGGAWDMSDQSESARSTRSSERVHSSFSGSISSETNYGSGIAIQCQYCPGQGFRRSSVRARDLQDLFFMRYPVRCLRCGQRQMVSFTVASVSVPSHIKQRRHRRSAEKFANWPHDAVPLQSGATEAAETKGAGEETDGPPGEL